jgi:hypothetical protein
VNIGGKKWDEKLGLQLVFEMSFHKKSVDRIVAYLKMVLQIG